jgi:hypothetical protein
MYIVLLPAQYILNALNSFRSPGKQTLVFSEIIPIIDSLDTCLTFRKFSWGTAGLNLRTPNTYISRVQNQGRGNGDITCR